MPTRSFPRWLPKNRRPSPGRLRSETCPASPGPVARLRALDEMAARIGSTREIVCRFLQKFAADGLIRITRTEFEVTSLERLTSMAQKEKS